MSQRTAGQEMSDTVQIAVETGDRIERIKDGRIYTVVDVNPNRLYVEPRDDGCRGWQIVPLLLVTGSLGKPTFRHLPAENSR